MRGFRNAVFAHLSGLMDVKCLKQKSGFYSQLYSKPLSGHYKATEISQRGNVRLG